nr:transglycosylase domain-containing protein [Polynucleobacter necessarius]
MQIHFVLQIALWTSLDPSSTAFQRAERWRLCTWHWTCSVQSRWASYDKISNNLKQAVLVSEDDIFFQNKGVRVEDMQKAWGKTNNRIGKNPKLAIHLKPHCAVAQPLLSS